MQALNVSAVVVLAAIAAASCTPADTCASSAECPLAQTCTAGQCVPTGGGGGGRGGTTGNGNGNGNGDGDGGVVRVQTGFPVTMLQEGPTSGQALVGLYIEGAEDSLRTFDLATGDILDADSLDFRNTAIGGGSCSIDAVSREEDIAIDDDGGDELWFSCNDGGLHQAQDDEDFQNFVVAPGAEGADLMLRLVQSDILDPDLEQRRVYARRGTSELTIEQMRRAETLSPGTVRARDTLEDVTFGEIAGLFLVDETDNNTYGDLVLVFDRAYPGNNDEPALVPIERQNLVSSSTRWAAARSPWRVLPLPANTHAVRVNTNDIPDPNQLFLDNASQTRVNLEVYLPTEGLVAVGRLETEMNNGGDLPFDPNATGFASLLFEPGGGTEVPSEVPDAEDRILIVDVPGSVDEVFYVLTNGAWGWRLRLPRNSDDGGAFTNEVLRARFDDESSDLPADAVALPGAGDQLWLSFAQPADQIHLVTFALNN